MKKKLLFFAIVLLSTSNVHASRRNQPPPDFLKYAKVVADAEIYRNPARSHTTWNHHTAFLNKALMRLFEATEIGIYRNFVREIAENLVDEEGLIETFNVEEFDLRNLLGGIFLYDLFLLTRDRRYLNAMIHIRRQLHRQPRLPNRLFWFSQAHENEVRLDGFFTAMPFYSLYAAIFNEPAVFGDITVQIRRIDERTLDERTGLNFQAWDNSRTRTWSRNETGTTQALFAQSIGFYLMALVDILDYFPVDHHYRDEIIRRINRITRALERMQDSRTGMWFQVVNMPRDSQNFLETSATAMIAYAIAKGVNNGYLRQRDRQIAERAFMGLVNNSLENGNLTRTTTEASLDNSDGTFSYYVNLPQTSNELTAIAAFILAAIELAR